MGTGGWGSRSGFLRAQSLVQSDKWVLPSEAIIFSLEKELEENGSEDNRKPSAALFWLPTKRFKHSRLFYAICITSCMHADVSYVPRYHTSIWPPSYYVLYFSELLYKGIILHTPYRSLVAYSSVLPFCTMNSCAATAILHRYIRRFQIAFFHLLDLQLTHT